MSKHLVESIIDGDFIQAETYFHDRLNAIMEQKLYEYKTTIDLCELVEPTGRKNADGGPEYKGQNTKADWAKYRKQHPTMSFYGTPGDPKAKKPKEKHEKTSTGTLTKHGIEARRKRGYLPASDAINATKFIRGVNDYLEKKRSEQNLKEFDEFDKEVERLAANKAASRNSNFAKKEKEVTPGGSSDSSMDGVDRFFARKAKEKNAGSRFASHLGKALSTVATGTRTTGDGNTVGASRWNAAKQAGSLVAQGAKKAMGPTVKNALGGAASGFTSALTSMREEKG